MVTDQQVMVLRQKLMEGKGQQAAAAASDMSVRTARTWQRGRLPSERKGKRRWRTRPDPFAAVWAEEVEPLLRSDVEGSAEGDDDPGVARRAASRPVQCVAASDATASSS